MAVKVEVYLIPELARQGKQHVGYRPKANVRVWGSGDVTEYRLDGPPNAVQTKQQANDIMRTIVVKHLRDKGWQHAEIIEPNDPTSDGRPVR